MQQLIAELIVFIDPLKRAGENSSGLSLFLSEFGIDISASALNGAGSAINDFQSTTTQLISGIDALMTSTSNLENLSNADPAAIAQLTSAATQLYNRVDPMVQAVRGNVGSISHSQFVPDLLDDIFNHLIDQYLASRAPTLREIFGALGVRNLTLIEPGDAQGRNKDYYELRYDWSTLGDFITDTEDWADTQFGWGSNFDHVKALSSLARIANTLGARARYESIDPAVLGQFIQNAPAGDPLDPSDQVFRVQLPVFEQGADADEADASAYGEAGFVALPFGNMASRADLGLAIAPYLEGNVNAEIPISDLLTFLFEADAQTTGGAFITIKPSGVGVTTGNTTSAEFEASIEYKTENGQPIIVLGDEDTTRLQIDSASVSAGGSLDGDVFVAARAKNASFIIDVGDDGLLSAVISDPISITIGDIAFGWRHSRGAYIEGGSNLGLIVPVDLRLGPLNIYEFGLGLDLTKPALRLTTTLDLTIGPLFAYADGIGLEAELVERDGGMFGRHDLEIGFVPPTGYAIAINAPPIEGGGLLERTETGYRGALALKFQVIGFSAFGILDTELPDGSEGFSFAASIFGEFNVPLAFGFFLTGVGGIIGINRTVDSDALRDVLYEGRLDNILFPADPIQNAATILDDMAAIFPADLGQHIVGPVVKIGWGQPILIDVKLGLILEVGDEIRIIILGGLGTALPTKEAAIVEINLSFFGEIHFGEKTISFDASLINSRVLSYTIGGDAAIRTGWADRLEHVVSFGGLHPQFPRPSNLPDLRRISLNFGSTVPRVTISGYTAVTSNSLQFGARADLYAKGPKIWLIGQLAAEGYVYFDALVYFDPFSFDIALGGGLNLLRNGKTVIGLGFSLRLTGPNTFYISGKVWVKVFGQKIKFGITHRWGSKQTIIYDTVDPAEILLQALEKSNGFEPIKITSRSSGVTFTNSGENAQLIDPLGGVRLVQQAVPLGVKLDKIGEARPPSGRDKVDINVRSKTGDLVDTGAAHSDFVRGHFFQISDSEKLRATAFDRLRSGFDVGDEDVVTNADAAVTSPYEYEYIEIPVLEAPTIVKADVAFANDRLTNSIVERFAHLNLGETASAASILKDIKSKKAEVSIKATSFVEEAAFTQASTVFEQVQPGPDFAIRDQLAAENLAATSFQGLQESVAEVETLRSANPVIEDFVLAAGQF